MYNLDNITEMIYEIDSDLQLKQELMRKSVWYNGDPHCKVAHLVFSGQKDNICIIYFKAWHTDGFLEGTKPFKTTLSSFLNTCENPGISDLVFFMKIYPNHLYALNKTDKQVLSKSAELDSLLRETRGFLMWEYQLDMVIRLFAPDLNVCEVTQLRRELQTGEKHAVSRTKKIKWKEMRLYDVVAERVVYNCSMVAGNPATDINEARRLYEAIAWK